MLTDLRRRGLIRPGRMQINQRHPYAKELSYFRLFDSLNPKPLQSRSAENLAVSSGATLKIASTPTGIGLTGGTNSDWMAEQTANGHTVTARHTWLAYVTANFSATDSASHFILAGGQSNNDTSVEIHLLKFSDNNWYLGIYNNGTDQRKIVAASGTYTAGVPFVVGYTWVTNGNVEAWIGGVSKGTRGAAAATPTTSGNNFFLGGAFAGGVGTHAWARDNTSCIHWVAGWDRVLDNSEINYLNFDPYCFLEEKDKLTILQVPLNAGGLFARYYYEMGMGRINV